MGAVLHAGDAASPPGGTSSQSNTGGIVVRTVWSRDAEAVVKLDGSTVSPGRPHAQVCILELDLLLAVAGKCLPFVGGGRGCGAWRKVHLIAGCWHVAAWRRRGWRWWERGKRGFKRPPPIRRQRDAVLVELKRKPDVARVDQPGRTAVHPVVRHVNEVRVARRRLVLNHVGWLCIERGGVACGIPHVDPLRVVQRLAGSPVQHQRVWGPPSQVRSDDIVGTVGMSEESLNQGEEEN